jgi:hypothetical protein
MVAAEVDPVMSTPEDPIMAIPTARVLLTSEAQSEGLVAGAPCQGEGNLATGGESAEGVTFI